MKTILFITSILFLSCSQGVKDRSTEKKETAEKKTEVKTPDLTKYGIANYLKNELGGLKVGDIAPDFKLENENGDMVSLEESLKSGPVLLVFYRADWCPYCTKHLAEFQDNIIDIKEKGNASVIAISPQLSKYSKQLSEENGYNFPILFDADHVAMKDYKVFFRVTDEYNDLIFGYENEYIQDRNGDTNPYLPVPATYMIGQDKRIKFVHYDPDYRKRADVDKALSSIMN